MLDCCKDNMGQFKSEINKILGRLFTQYYNITFLALVDNDGNVIDFHIHKIGHIDEKKKLEEVLKKTIDFKIASTKTAKILDFEAAQESFTKADSHIVATYDLNNFFLVIYIEMSKPLIDLFDFEKFNEKIELILIEIKKKIESLQNDKDLLDDV